MELLRNLLMDQAKNKMSPMQQGQRQMQGMASVSGIVLVVRLGRAGTIHRL